MNKSVKLYKNAIVKNSTIGNNSIIGDDSRLIDCKLFQVCHCYGWNSYDCVSLFLSFEPRKGFVN